MKRTSRESRVAFGLVVVNVALLLAVRVSVAWASQARVQADAPALPGIVQKYRPIDGRSWKQDNISLAGTATVLRVFSSRGFLLDRGELVFAYVDECLQNPPQLHPGDRVFVRGQSACCARFNEVNHLKTEADKVAVWDPRWQTNYALVSEIRPVMP